MPTSYRGSQSWVTLPGTTAVGGGPGEALTRPGLHLEVFCCGSALDVACHTPGVRGRYERANNALIFNQNRSSPARKRLSDALKPGQLLLAGTKSSGDEPAILSVHPETDTVTTLSAARVSVPSAVTGKRR